MFKLLLTFIISLVTLIVAYIGGLSLVYAIVIYNILSWAFVGAKFYAWFVLPVFANLPSIGFATMAGIYMFVNVFMPKTVTKSDKTNLFGFLIAPWVFLLLGWFFTVV